MNVEDRLHEEIAKCAHDPLRFVNLAYPWGEQGALEEYDGPDVWQTDILNTIKKELARSDDAGAIRIAVSSGHGIGKSALDSWLIHWFISTRPFPQIVCTANTRDQLMKKLWRELSVWHKRSINTHWHNWTATKFYNINNPEDWFAAAIPWSKENSEAFAGTHAKHVLIIFDEASAIDDSIWEVTEGAMTTKGAIWLAFGNPTRNSGRFFDCFNRFKHRWITRTVDSRTARMTDKAQLQQWIDDYGDDSDFVRVRIKGEFPRAANSQFIDIESVERAMSNRVKQDDTYAARIVGVDVARFGDDKSIILKRHGNRVLPLMKFVKFDTMQLAAQVARVIDDWNPDAVFVDGDGVGAGVVDRLRELNYRVIEVHGAAKPLNDREHANKRAESWDAARRWLQGDVELPANDSDLKNALISIEYGFNERLAIQLERKDDMKKRGLPSPDEGDALALTFAAPVRTKSMLILPEAFYGANRRSEQVISRPRRCGLDREQDWRI